MAAVGGIIRFTYTSEEDIVPREATHIFVDAAFIRAHAFAGHPNIVEVICSERVKKIEREAFSFCPRLRRVIMRGVKEVEVMSFYWCNALEDVECGKLEIVEEKAFGVCKSLKSISLLCARIVQEEAFDRCETLTDVKFSNKLKSLGHRTFGKCRSLRRITIPLKDNLINDGSVFWECYSLKRVDLVEGAVLQETIASFESVEWRHDMNREIQSINRILPNASAGGWHNEYDWYDDGEKTHAIRMWLRSVLHKIIDYKAEHRRILVEAATAIQRQFALPNDILTNNVLPFLALPSYTFEGEKNEERKALNSVTEDKQKGHDAEQGDDHDFSGDDEEEVDDEEYGEHGSGRVKRQRQ